jgi:hypothetical protein
MKYMTCLSKFKGNLFSPQMVEKYSNIKSRDNLTSIIQGVSIIKRYMTDQTLTHHNCVKSPKIVI